MPNFIVVRGEESNVINADLSFVESQNFDSFELEVEPAPEPLSDEEELLALDLLARQWRDEELKNSDWIVAVTDHPQRADYITYRAALRSWPSTSDFPDTKPTLGE
jgi:hypothetical protein